MYDFFVGSWSKLTSFVESVLDGGTDNLEAQIQKCPAFATDGAVPWVTGFGGFGLFHGSLKLDLIFFGFLALLLPI